MCQKIISMIEIDSFISDNLLIKEKFYDYIYDVVDNQWKPWLQSVIKLETNLMFVPHFQSFEGIFASSGMLNSLIVYC